MMHFINYIVSLAKAYVAMIIICTIGIQIWSAHYTDNLFEESAPAKYAVMKSKFTPSFIGSPRYLNEKKYFYIVNCPDGKKINQFCPTERYSHERYIEDRYGKVIDIVEERKESYGFFVLWTDLAKLFNS